MASQSPGMKESNSCDTGLKLFSMFTSGLDDASESPSLIKLEDDAK